MKQWRTIGLMAVVLVAACGNSESVDVVVTEMPAPVTITPTPAPSTPPAAPVTPKVEEGRIDDTLISESSGLARSQLRDDLVWTHNDSGGNAELYALTLTGKHVATVAISGATNLDWEDIASYTRNGVAYLLVGDMGDNNAFRPQLTFYEIAEPVVIIGTSVQSLSATPNAIVSATYPTGPRDAESLAVDAATNTAYVLSKRDAQPTLYSFSLATPANLMTNLGAINIPRAPAGYMGDATSFNYTTAMDFSDDGTRAYVGTYLNGYFWDRKAGETWVQAFARTPRSFALPKYSQTEAGTFARGRKDQLFVSSENLPAPLTRITVPEGYSAP